VIEKKEKQAVCKICNSLFAMGKNNNDGKYFS